MTAWASTDDFKDRVEMSTSHSNKKMIGHQGWLINGESLIQGPTDHQIWLSWRACR